MKLAIASLTVALLCAAPAYAQDGTATPDKGTATAPPTDSKPGASGQSGVGVNTPKIDPKLIIDVFKHLTKPRPRPAPPPAAPLPVEPAEPVVAAPAPVPPPAVVTPPPRPVPAAAPAAVAAPVVKPRPAPPPAVKAPRPPAPVAVAVPVGPAEPVIATPVEPPPPPPVTPVREASAPVPAPPLPIQRNASLLSQSQWLLLALLAGAGAIAAAPAWSRARRIGRTRAALSLDSRLDLAEGSCSTGGLALACPPMSIRTRLDFA